MTRNPRLWIPAIVLAVIAGQALLWFVIVPPLVERIPR